MDNNDGVMEREEKGKQMKEDRACNVLPNLSNNAILVHREGKVI